MAFNTLIYDKEKEIGIVTFNRPERMNAINAEFMKEFNIILDQIDEDDEVAVVILTGHEKFFCAGADITELIDITSGVKARHFVKNIHALFNKLADFRKPVIAAVGGLALGGGCEISLASDIRIAAENAKFGLPEIKLGVLPGGGGTQRLPRLIGSGRAKELLFSGEPIEAQEAYRIGLANKLVPYESLLDEAKKMAMTFVERPSYALSTIKSLVNEGLSMDLDSALAHERALFETLFATEDQTEGMNAFLEKRKAVFKGR